MTSVATRSPGRAILALLSSLALALTLLPASPVDAADHTPVATDLLLSEYIEGSSFNKAVEIHNGTGAAVDLQDYQLELYSNGSAEISQSVVLGSESASLADGGTFVVANASADPAILAETDLVSSAVANFNGDDALVLANVGGDTREVVDSFGQVGVDPGSAWSGGGVSTVNATLRRSGTERDTDPTDAFDPSTRWTAFPNDAFDDLGSFALDPSDPDPEPEPEPICDADALTPISQVQGPGDESPIVGQDVTVEAVVTLVAPGLDGLFVQEEPDDRDGDPDTSEGLFVFTDGNFLDGSVRETDTVQITGPASEFFGKTQLTSFADVAVCDVAPVDIEPVDLPLPSSPAEREHFENMLVTATDLVVSGSFSAYSFGELITGYQSELPSATQVATPGSDAEQAADEIKAREVILDDRQGGGLDDRSVWDQDPERRLGDAIPEVTGVLDYSFDNYKIQYTAFPEFELFGTPEVPRLEQGNDIGAFNVLNFFQDFDGRGARDADQFALQSAKIVETILELDPAVLGLIELQNDYLLDVDGDDGTQPSVGVLVDLLNDAAGTDRYDYVSMPEDQLLVDDAAEYGGGVGSDAIANGIIYQPAKATQVAQAATFDIDAGLSGDDEKNRWPFAASFDIDGQLATVAVNHFKSKGSGCEDVVGPDFAAGEDDGSTLAGNCDLTRQYAADELVDWVATDPTGAGTDNVFLVGDLNSYAEEAPIQILEDAGYLNTVEELADGAFTYKFSGRVGTLDYILASRPAAAIVDDAAVWQTNSRASYVDLYYIADDTTEASGNLPKGASDHDPLVLSLLAADDDPDPTVPTDKDDCKDGGWRSFTDPSFRNQGQCVAFVASGELRGAATGRGRSNAGGR